MPKQSRKQRLAIGISKHCAKPKNKKSALCRLHFRLKKLRRK